MIGTESWVRPRRAPLGAFSLCDAHSNFYFCAAHFLRRFLAKYAVYANFCYKKTAKIRECGADAWGKNRELF